MKRKKLYLIIKYILNKNYDNSMILEEKAEIKRNINKNDLKSAEFIGEIETRKVIKNRTEMDNDESFEYFFNLYKTKINLEKKVARVNKIE